jgi:hypothetical protein
MIDPPGTEPTTSADVARAVADAFFGRILFAGILLCFLAGFLLMNRTL